MVEISKSGSGEGLGWVTGRGYSTKYPISESVGRACSGHGCLRCGMATSGWRDRRTAATSALSLVIVRRGPG